jgi:hypothetical protein
VRDGRKNPHFAKLEKGLNAVGNLAQLLNGLAMLQQACQWEAENEGDNSPVPAALMAAVKQLSDALIAMANEETQELIATLSPSDAPAGSPLAQQDKTGGLKKAGARNSAADLKHLQAAHDHLVACGASCNAKPEEGAKLEAAGSLRQGELLADLMARLKKLEDQPQPLPRFLRAVEKEEDMEAEVKKDAIASTPGMHNPEAAEALIKRQLVERWNAR